jgi:hypothetical protein
MYFSQEPFADWNGNGQWDEGEYFNDLDNSGSWTDSAFELDYDANGMLMAPDGEVANEDGNNNFILESESATDTWYGNGQLDSEDLNGNGVLDEGEDINGNNVLDSEDLDRNGSLTEFSMFDRLPLWERMSKMWNIENSVRLPLRSRSSESRTLLPLISSPSSSTPFPFRSSLSS